MKKNQILLKSGTNFKEMTKDLLEFANLEEQILNKSSDKHQRIAVKPNLVLPSEASWGATTHPEVVAGIIEYLQAKGFDNLVMMEGSWIGDKTSDAYELCGYRDLEQTYQVPFLDMQKEKSTEVDCAGMNLRICNAVFDVDFLINVPVLKGHCQTKVTCALKNMKGLIPNTEKRHFHKMGLHKPIAHLGIGIHQDFIVVDNICGDLDFEDGGNPVVMNRVLCGCDPVLMDAYASSLLHYEVEDIPYIVLAEQLGVGSADLSNTQIIAIDQQKIEEMPKSRKVVEILDAVEEVESCSACYGYLIPALDMLRENGKFGILKEKLQQIDEKIRIGQGFRGKTGEIGVGNCTRKFRCSCEGCPPTENQIYDFLMDYIQD